MERELAAQRLILPNERDRCVDIRLVVSQDIQQVRQIFVQHHIVALIEHAVLIGVFPNVVMDLVVQDLILFLTGDVLPHQQEELIHGGRIVLQQGPDRVLLPGGTGALAQIIQREGLFLHRPVDGLQSVQLVGVQVLQAETQLCKIDRHNARSRGRTSAAGCGRRDRCAAGTARLIGRAAAGEQPLDPGENAEVIRGNGRTETLHYIRVIFHLCNGTVIGTRRFHQWDHIPKRFPVDSSVTIGSAGEQLVKGIAALGGRFFRTACRGTIRCTFRGTIRCAFRRARHGGLLPRFLIQRGDHFVRGVGFLRADGQAGNGVEGHVGRVAQRHEEISGVLLALESDLRRKTQLGRAQSGHRGLLGELCLQLAQHQFKVVVIGPNGVEYFVPVGAVSVVHTRILVVVLCAASVLLGKVRHLRIRRAQAVQLRAPRQLGDQQQQYGRRQRRAAKENEAILPRLADGGARAGEVIHLRIAEVEIGHGRALAQQPLSVEAGLRRLNGDVQQLRQRLRKPRLIRLTAGENGARQLCVGGHGGKIVKHDAHFIQIVLLGIAPLQQTLQLHLPVVDEGQQQQLALRVHIEADALIRVRSGGRRVLGGGEAGAHGGSMAVTAEIYGGHAQSHAVGKGVIVEQHRPGRGPELHPQKLRAIVLLRTQRLP